MMIWVNDRPFDPNWLNTNINMLIGKKERYYNNIRKQKQN